FRFDTSAGQGFAVGSKCHAMHEILGHGERYRCPAAGDLPKPQNTLSFHWVIGLKGFSPAMTSPESHPLGGKCHGMYFARHILGWNRLFAAGGRVPPPPGAGRGLVLSLDTAAGGQAIAIRGKGHGKDAPPRQWDHGSFLARFDIPQHDSTVTDEGQG